MALFHTSLRQEDTSYIHVTLNQIQYKEFKPILIKFLK